MNIKMKLLSAAMVTTLTLGITIPTHNAYALIPTVTPESDTFKVYYEIKNELERYGKWIKEYAYMIEDYQMQYNQLVNLIKNTNFDKYKIREPQDLLKVINYLEQDYNRYIGTYNQFAQKSDQLLYRMCQTTFLKDVDTYGLYGAGNAQTQARAQYAEDHLCSKIKTTDITDYFSGSEDEADQLAKELQYQIDEIQKLTDPTIEGGMAKLIQDDQKRLQETINTIESRSSSNEGANQIAADNRTLNRLLNEQILQERDILRQILLYIQQGQALQKQQATQDKIAFEAKQASQLQKIKANNNRKSKDTWSIK